MFHAAVAELADAYRSGRYGDFSVQVRFLSAAYKIALKKAFIAISVQIMYETNKKHPISI